MSIRRSMRSRAAACGAYFSLGGVVLALVAAVLTQLVHTIAPPPSPPDACATPPPLVVSLPAELPGLPATPATSTAPASSVTPPPSPRAATLTGVSASASATPSLGPPASIETRRLFRGDDPPAAHGLAVGADPLMPLVVPAPCLVPGDARRTRVEPCVKLLPPGGRLCASGAAGEGRLSTADPGSSFALQAGRVTLQDVDGATLFDEIQGYVRYDDPARGLQLLCPRIAYLERVSSNAVRIVALCSNRGADGWAVSGQVTDGGINAPDSAGLTVDAPDGSQIELVGSVASGVILVRLAE